MLILLINELKFQVCTFSNTKSPIQLDQLSTTFSSFTYAHLLMCWENKRKWLQELSQRILSYNLCFNRLMFKTLFYEKRNELYIFYLKFKVAKNWADYHW